MVTRQSSRCVLQKVHSMLLVCSAHDVRGVGNGSVSNMLSVHYSLSTEYDF